MKTIDDYPITIIEDLPPVLDKKSRVAIDTEFFNMDKPRLHRPIKIDGSPNGVFGCLTLTFDGETVYFIDDEKKIQEALNRIKDAVWIFANMDFDITQLRRYAEIPDRKKMWDVLVMEKIIYPGYYDLKKDSLKSLCRRYLHTYVEKDVRDEFETAIEFTPETKKYSAYDPLLTWRVYQEQRKHTTKTDFKLWRDIELPATWILLSRRGFPFDGEKWCSIADDALELKKKMHEKYPELVGRTQFSGKKIAEKLVEMGYDIPTTEKGNLKSDRKTFQNLKNPNEFVEEILAYSDIKARTTTYGKNYLKDLEHDGKMFASIQSIGTVSGRPSAVRPNVFNVPNAAYDVRYRQSYIAGERKLLVVADWSAQEPRISAYLTQDPKLMGIFIQGLDVYCEAARLMYGWVIDKSDPRRKTMKPVVLGANYGLSPWGMQIEYGIPIEEGKKHLEAFFNTFTEVDAYIESLRDGRDVVYSDLGRKRYMNNYSHTARNEVINHPIQSLASDIMKVTMIEFVEKWGKNDIINMVYDELVLEVNEDEVDDASKLLGDVMVDVAQRHHPGIPAIAEIGIGKTWADAKV